MKRRDFITKGISAGVVAGAGLPLLAKENAMTNEVGAN